MTLENCLILGAVLFCIGLLGALTRRNAQGGMQWTSMVLAHCWVCVCTQICHVSTESNDKSTHVCKYGTNYLLQMVVSDMNK